MPYITEKDREALDFGFSPRTPGELNYVLTKQVLLWLGYEPNYERYNAVLGVLTAMQHELYRRRIADYEDEKKLTNGEVYE